MQGVLFSAILLLFVTGAAVAICVLLCRWAYRCGVESGNLTMSIILIMLTSLIGLCYLAGASKHENGMAFDQLHREHRELVNERVRHEISQKSTTGKLMEIDSLLEESVITQDEYSSIRKRILETD